MVWVLYVAFNNLKSYNAFYQDIGKMWQGVLFPCLILYSAATSLKYDAPNNWHDIPPSHIILTLVQPVLALAVNPSQALVYPVKQIWWVII